MNGRGRCQCLRRLRFVAAFCLSIRACSAVSRSMASSTTFRRSFALAIEMSDMGFGRERDGRRKKSEEDLKVRTRVGGST